MISILKRLRVGIKERNLKYYLFQYKEPIQSRPYNISYNTIISIFKYMPRDKWYEIIKPLCWDLRPERNGIEILDDFNDPYPFDGLNTDILYFNIEDLKKTKFDIEPYHYYTHKELGGVFLSSDYVALDERCNYYNLLAKDRALFGSVVEGIGVTNSGKTYGWEKGKLYLSPSDVFYDKFTPIEYVPKEGTFFYYMEKLYRREITEKCSDIYNATFEGATAGMEINIADTSNKEYFESFFNEY